MARNGASTVIACAAFALVLLDSCGGEPCQGACACPPADCPDLRITAADNGKTVRLAVGEWATVELPDHSVPATASSSNPKVISQVGKLKVAFVSQPGPPSPPYDRPPTQKIYASFHAVKAGSAWLTIAYLKCPDAPADPCSYEVDVNVVQFPKTEVTIDNVYEQNTVKIRLGEAVRFTAPYESDPLWTVTIDSPNVVKWAVEPIYLSHSLFEAAVTAVSAGTAHVHAGRCSSSAPVCSNPWRLTFVVT